MNNVTRPVIIIGAGPAGLAAAEVISSYDVPVIILEAGRRPGIKFLVAGRSGLNLTMDADARHVIDRCTRDQFGQADASKRSLLEPCLRAFPPTAIRDWAHGLGNPTKVGTSGKVFPEDHHGAGLLRNWEQRLSGQGVQIETNFKVVALEPTNQGGWDIIGPRRLNAEHVICALGGGSWPQTGSDGAWQDWLSKLQVQIHPLRSANCGVEVNWDDVMVSRYQGEAIKNVIISHPDTQTQGEVVVTRYGIEGFAIYPLIPYLRREIEDIGYATLMLDLARDLSPEDVMKRLGQVRAKASMTNKLRSALKLSPAAIGLLHYAGLRHCAGDFQSIAALVKSCPVVVKGLRPLEEAISTAGGVAVEMLDSCFQFKHLPNLYAVGEMVDWEAPTGGYLLSASIAMGHYVGHKVGQKMSRPK